jgi:hypothetical protein
MLPYSPRLNLAIYRAFAVLSCLCVSQAKAEPSLIGQSGLIAMPDARIDAESTWCFGLSQSAPYTTLWSSVTALPWLEVSGRVTRIADVPGFPGSSFADTYGAYKDKTFDLKLRLADESPNAPALSLGLQDYLGTGIFRANYLAASKRFGEVDFTLGVGEGRIDGAFAGLRYTPAWWPDAALSMEYDANDYAGDHGAALSGADQREQGLNLALEYRHGPYTAQLSHVQGEWGLNAHARIALDGNEFVPKTEEPEPYTRPAVRPGEAEWHADPGLRRRMHDTLLAHDFNDIRIQYAGRHLHVSLGNLRISHLSRAIGRAVRIALALTPRETREIVITYRKQDLALATYTFVDLKRLDEYFSGLATRRQLAATIRIEHAAPADIPDETPELLDALDAQRAPLRIADKDTGDVVALSAGDGFHRQLHIAPKLSLFVNDPSGAFRYDAHALANYRQRLGRGQYLEGALRLTLAEDISQVTTRSNSLLPHVRSDVAEYKRGAKLKLDRLVWNRYWQPAQRQYARASVGLYEEMYAGLGGQWLYFPEQGNWAADLSMDWLKQRDFEGVGLRDYDVVSGMASLHYRFPKYGLTTTLRAGRFLAGDEGARIELKRRFRSGIEMGAWYTVTNGNDITSPGSPSSPYNDKGLFLSIPMHLVLPRDTQGVAHYALSPWTRDVGQMVASPGDLYALLEKPLRLDMADFDGLQSFGDVNDDDRLPQLGEGVSDWQRGARFAGQVADGIGDLFAPRTLVGAAGLTLLAGSLDQRAADFSQKHGQSDALRQVRQAGDGMALLAWAGSAGLALIDDDPRLTRTAAAAFQAGTGTLAVSGALRYALGRERPQDGHGTASFNPFEAGNLDDSSFPSLTSGLTWAVLTPYAREYDLPWLYGIATLSSLAQASGREHWLSDAVGGGVLGYLLGSQAWRSNRKTGSGPDLWLAPDAVGLAWKTQ